MQRNNSILKGHLRVGKKFKPPLLNAGPLQETSWAKYGLPEFLWLGLLRHDYGPNRGLELAIRLAKASSDNSQQKTWFAATSAFSSLTLNEKNKVLDILKLSEGYEDIIRCLTPLLSLYPNCPLGFLADNSALQIEQDKEIERLKSVVLSLFDKAGQRAMQVITYTLYIGFETDMLKISTGTTFLDDFEEIEDYPDTEISRMVGSKIRATFNVLIGAYPFGHDWPNYFWNRGLEITPCEFGGVEYE